MESLNKYKTYFEVLGISENASNEDIKNAYKHLVFKFHPDKCNSSEGEKKFKKITEAYHILMNNKDSREGNIHKSCGREYNNGFNPFYFFSPTFQKSFGANNNNNNTTATNNNNKFAKKELLFQDLFITLEEIATGTIKYVKIMQNNLKGEIIKKVLEIKINPGWKEGTKITFHDEGIIFTLKNKPHPIFQREGSNLIYVVSTLTLRDALCGNYNINSGNNINNRTITVPCSLDGKEKLTIQLEKDEIIKPQTIKVLSNLGLPFPNNLQCKGDIIIKFDIKFPNTLTRNMKNGIAKLLDDDDNNNNNNNNN